MATEKFSPASTPAPARFGELLRQHRLAAGLTQEGLAERAGLSEHGIQKLESGATHPYRDTAERLIRALNLSERDQAVLQIAARPKPRRQQSPRRGASDTPAVSHSHLPIQATTFIARSGEIETVKKRLQDNRLITLIGPGGSGKTRLALQVACQIDNEFGDGVWLIDLAPLVDPALVPQTIASTIGIVAEPGRAALDVLTEYFQSRHALLILDNCEHLIDASAAVVDTVLQSCARVQFLATSREMLGVPGEALWRVSTLSVVDRRVTPSDDTGLVEEVCESESGRLFIDRARLVAPSFTVTPQNAHMVAQVCHRLDGMPLSIELAAARLSMLSIDQIAERLDQSFRLLTGGNRTAVRRQQTIRATIDWSYQLLSEPERNLVRRFAVFAGGWCLEAAEALAADALQPEEDVLDLLSRLVAKSMVLVDNPPETRPSAVRYRFLETIRQYAEEKLVEGGEADLVRTRHRDWYLTFAEQAMEGMEGADQKLWWDRLNLELDNLRMALNWSASDPTKSTPLLRLAGLLGRFWALRGLASEGIRWLELALAQSPTDPSSDRARALDWLGALALFNGHIERACALLEESVAQARTVADRRVLSVALAHLTGALRSMGDVEQAWRRAQEAIAISREGGFASQLAWSLVNAAQHLANAGQFESVEPLLLESASAGRQSGAVTSVLASTGLLAQLYMMRGDLTRARRSVDEAMALADQVGIPLPTVSLLITRGDLATAELDWTNADHWYRQALSTATVAGARGIVAVALRHYAALCVARGDPGRAVRIFAATASIQGAPLLIHFSMIDEDIILTARRALGEDEFAVASVEGQSMTLEHVVTQILGAPRDSENQR